MNFSGNYIIKEEIGNYKYSHANSLRFLLSKDEFEGYNNVYFTDIDMLFFGMDIEKYYSKVMGISKQPIACVGGAHKKPINNEIAPNGWNGNVARVAGGYVMVKNPQWFDKTYRLRKYYLENLKHDCTYKEYDEVMLARTCVKSGIEIPVKRRYFITGQKFNVEYRGIHLGDFRYLNRLKKLNDYVSENNLKRFAKLWKSEKFRRIIKDVIDYGDLRKTYGTLIGLCTKRSLL